MTIAVLAVQGAFIEHRHMLAKLGVNSFEIRNKTDLERDFDGLILPGGESTVMGKLMHELDLFSTLKSKIQSGLPVFGTCAGLILLANNIENDKAKHLALMDISIVRNGYGRQLGSFNSVSTFADCGEIPLTFIRAPYISKVGKNVQVLTTCDNKIVAVKEKNMLATAFHPEVTNDITVHKFFINNMCK